MDWPENLRDDYNAYIDKNKYGIDCHNVLNSFYIGAIKALNEISQLLGKKTSYDIEVLKNSFIKIPLISKDKKQPFSNPFLKNSLKYTIILPLT